jgi:hypothetical protein
VQDLAFICAELESWLKFETLPEPDLVMLKTQLCSRLDTLIEELARQPELLRYGVEINKQMRLLSSDFLNYEAARQPEKRALRQAQIFKRLKLLLGYCQTIDKLISQ